MNIEEIKLLEEKIIKSKNISLDDVDIKNIDDISNIKINEKKSSIDRILDFLKMCKNPYIYNVNGMIVKIGFAENTDLTATECVTRTLKNEYIK